MAKGTDDGWLTFMNELAPFTPKKLHEQLEKLTGKTSGLTPATTSNWKQGKARPAFADLPKISIAIGQAPTYLAEKMGMIPSATEEAGKIVKLQSRVEALQKLQAELDPAVADYRNRAVGKVVTEAARSGKWAVGVWPAIEGPKGYEMHVSDRLDFTRVDGTVAPREQLENDLRLNPDNTETALGKALDNAHAVYSPNATPRWSDRRSIGTSGHDASSPAGTVLRYSVPRLTALFSPGIATPLATQGSVAVVSLSVHSWAMDTAGFLARLLNYGFTSTRALSTQTHGFNIDPQVSRAARQNFHRSLLIHPETSYVWGHFEVSGAPEALFPPADQWPNTLTCVWVRESPTIFEKEIEKPAKYIDALDKTNEYVDAEENSRIIVVDVDYPTGDNSAMLSKNELRNAQMEQALRAAVKAVKIMVDRGFLDEANTQAAFELLRGDERSEIAKQMYKWLTAEKLLYKDWRRTVSEWH